MIGDRVPAMSAMSLEPVLPTPGTRILLYITVKGTFLSGDLPDVLLQIRVPPLALALLGHRIAVPFSF